LTGTPNKSAFAFTGTPNISACAGAGAALAATAASPTESNGLGWLWSGPKEGNCLRETGAWKESRSCPYCFRRASFNCPNWPL
jgi:hypothetical protein